MNHPVKFLYGLAVGLIVALGIMAFSESSSRWILVAAAGALALALFAHQRAVTRSKGRRWRKTI
jgi:hypothetical protein